jgi:hypothetical protein
MSRRSYPQQVRGAASSLVFGIGRGVFVELKVEQHISDCSRSSGVERILGKDEVGGSIPPASSRAISKNLNRLKQNNNHHG